MKLNIFTHYDTKLLFERKKIKTQQLNQCTSLLQNRIQPKLYPLKKTCPYVKYYVKEKHPVDPVITIYKSDQSVIAKFSGIKKDGKSKIPNEVGINHFIWDLRYQGPKPAPEDKANKLIAGPSPDGPLVVPGNYSIKLEISNETLIQDFEIKQDPKSEASQQDLENQLELLLKIRDSITTTNETVNQLRSTRTKLLSYIE